MRQGKKERKQKTKKQARKNLIINNGIYATSSIYTSNVLGVSLLGGNDSKFYYVKENAENKVIALIDKNNKKRLDKKLKWC